MKVKYLYLLLFLVGTVVPYWEFLNFLLENGLDTELLVNQLMATRISRFFACDVIISAVVLIVFILYEKKGMKSYWLALVATMTIGVSAGLPLFLYLCERRKQSIEA